MRSTSLIFVLVASLSLWATPPADRIGLQLWSLRKDFEQDTTKAAAEVKSFGITYVEPHSIYALTPAQFRAKLDEAGLKATAAHFQYDRLKKDLPGVIAEAKVLGVTYVILPWLPEDTFTADTARKLAADLNAWGAELKKAGLKMGYHPHGFEFVTVEGGGTAFDILAKATNPELVTFELDVFWAAHAGADPVALLNKYPNHWKLMHVKDMRKGATITPGKRSAPEEDNVAVGLGQIDWKGLLSAAVKNGVEYYFLEDETSTPQKNIPIGVDFLKTWKP
jgi:sugar phosphate isomerase/epimerase